MGVHSVLRFVLVFTTIPVGLVRAQSTVSVTPPPPAALPWGNVEWVTMSRDSRWLAFTSNASNLVPNDTNNRDDIFLVDRLSQSVERVNLRLGGSESSLGGMSAAISDDGRYVAFYDFDELQPGGSGVFVRDRIAGTTICVNKSTDGTLGQSSGTFGRIGISPDGRTIVFSSYAQLVAEDLNEVSDIYVHDRDADGNGVFDEEKGFRTVLISRSDDGSPGDGDSRYPHMTPDSRFVTFSSDATQLVPDDTNAGRDIFVHDRDADGDGVFDEPLGTRTERVSVKSGGGQADVLNTWWSSISRDGRFIVFHSLASDLVPDDTNGRSDVFLHDRLENLTSRISLSYAGLQSSGSAAMPQISENGRFVAFIAIAPDSIPNDALGNSPDLIILDRWNRTNKLGSFNWQGQQGVPIVMNPSSQSKGPTISADGRFVTFVTVAANMVQFQSPSMFAGVLRDRGPHIMADVDGAGVVNVGDLISILTNWGECVVAPTPCPADLNGDGTVNVTDLLTVIKNWG